MARRRQSFRFRIPWLSGPATEPVSRHPKDRSKSSTEPDTNVPIQRPPPPPPPPSRPPVITPAESPPSPAKTQGAPSADVQTQSPSHPSHPSHPTSSVVIGSPVTYQSEPPSQSKTPTPAKSPLPSPQPSSHAGSPSRFSIASSSPKTQPQSPSHLASYGAIEVSKPDAKERSWLASSASEQEKEKKVTSELMPQDAEQKVKSPLIAIPKSPATSFQPERMSTQPQYSEQQASSVPSSPLSKTEPTSDKPPPSSPLASEQTGEVLKPNAEESNLPASSASQEAKEKMALAVSESVPQEAEPKMKSPSKTISKSPETSFQPERLSQGSKQQASPVPSSPVSKTKPASDQPPPPSPLASERTNEVLKSNAKETTSPVPFASQEEKEKMAIAVPEAVPQETASKMNSPLKIIPKSPEASSKHENLSTHPTAILMDEKRSTTPETKKLELDSAAGSSKGPLEKQSKLLQSEEKEQVVHEPIKARKAKDTTTGKTSERMVASSSRTQAKDQFTRAFRPDKKQHGARFNAERKMMFATSKPSQKDIRVVSSADPGTRNASSISPERPVSSNGEKASLQKGIKDDISKFVHKLATVEPTQPVDDKQCSVITLAGDNRGATIQVGSESAKKEESIHIYRAHKTDLEESTEVTTDGEENTKNDSHSSTKHDEVGKAYINSNIQSINNSLMVHGSFTEKDPGVQVILPQKPAEPIKPDDKTSLNTHKSEFNMSRAEKLTYQPTVQRRCLRGLSLEPSDSDPDDPDKHRGHGSKVSCDNNQKDIDIEFM